MSDFTQSVATALSLIGRLDSELVGIVAARQPGWACLPASVWHNQPFAIPPHHCNNSVA
jgi:hypothetical protein